MTKKAHPTLRNGFVVVKVCGLRDNDKREMSDTEETMLRYRRPCLAQRQACIAINLEVITWCKWSRSITWQTCKLLVF